MFRVAVTTVRLRSGASGSTSYRVTPMAVAEKTPTTDRRIDLSEADLEKKVGDYLHRLRQASVAKFYDDQIEWGSIAIEPTEAHYIVYDVDGFPFNAIDREGQAIEQLVALFDKELEDALNVL
ncbi:hypothetical protein HRTV-21_gp115 [Halorubrum virus HRTV-21]|nr:hypothetical protein HRTV-21_gp115 [Halorubrum virus HRTV-21]